MKRVFLIVLDSLGIGAAPDAADFGDVGANTLRRLTGASDFAVPSLVSLGLSAIDGVDYLPKEPQYRATVARMRERSAGKDTTVGHFEIAGVVSEKPYPTYPDGFPARVLEPFAAATGRGILCNRPYSGTDVIRDYGDRHRETGDLIVYTSADSVFQIAAHEDTVPPEVLYEYCMAARAILQGEDGVGRVIARPFRGESGAYFRTENRRDFSLPPPRKTLLELLKDAGRDVIAVGKINDIFCGQGVTEAIPSHQNAEGMAAALSLLSRDFSGLAFINLVDFDMLYGHRNDIEGYARALMAFDRFLPSFLGGMREDDCLIITGDHGCDPGDTSTDHTREYTPLLMYSPSLPHGNLGTRESFADIAQTVGKLLSVDTDTLDGEAMI